MLLPLRSSLVALSAALGLLVTGCGSDEPDAADEPGTSDKTTSAPSSSPTTEPSASSPAPAKPAGTTIDITFEGDEVDPAGVERKVRAGKAITLHIVADAAGELHVHSSPEKEIAYPAGTSDHELTIDQPGVVEVESHHLERLVVQLQVR